MTKKEQIEEMSNIITEVSFVQAHEENGDEHLTDIVATALYNAGYRKGEEVRKETAKEILQCLYDKCYEIQNMGRGGIAHILPIDILQLAKHYGVEVEE